VQGSWALPIKEFVAHTLVYSIGFVLFATEAVYGSVITSLLSHVIASKLVLYVLTALEYTVVVGNALFVALSMVDDLLRILRRLMQ
jgi:hypothetical protein